MSTLTKRLSFILAFAFLLAGCATARAATAMPSPTPASISGNEQYAPQPGDNALVSDTVEFDSAEIAKSGSSTSPVQADIAYRLPTPCHQLRAIVSPADSSGRINIKMYSLMKPNTACTLMALATPLHVPLSLGSLPAGHYSVYVNEVKAVEFDR